KQENHKKHANLPTVFVLVGSLEVLHENFNVEIFTHNSGHNEFDLAKVSNKFVIFQTNHDVETYVTKFRKYFKVKVIVVRGDFKENRPSNRGVDFSGTLSECLEYLRSQ